MTEDYAIQQGQVKGKSPLPYALGGALLGTGAGYLGAKYTTSPKYKSYEDIIKDTEDSFKKNVETVYKEQEARDKAISARKAGVDEAAKFDAELEKAKAENAKLAENARKTEDDVIKEVEKKLGGTREELVKKAETQGKEDLAKLLEKKIPNKKLALWLAGGAVALGTLGYLAAPKKNKA